MRKRLLLGFALFAGLGLTLGFLWLNAPNGRVTAENIAAIERGMTIAQVEDLFQEQGVDIGPGDFVDPPTTGREWTGRERLIRVYFDESGGVVITDMREVEDFRAKLSRWLRLPWR